MKRRAARGGGFLLVAVAITAILVIGIAVASGGLGGSRVAAATAFPLCGTTTFKTVTSYDQTNSLQTTVDVPSSGQWTSRVSYPGGAAVVIFGSGAAGVTRGPNLQIQLPASLLPGASCYNVGSAP